jgi:hypothetical protein
MECSHVRSGDPCTQCEEKKTGCAFLHPGLRWPHDQLQDAFIHLLAEDQVFGALNDYDRKHVVQRLLEHHRLLLAADINEHYKAFAFVEQERSAYVKPEDCM